MFPKSKIIKIIFLIFLSMTFFFSLGAIILADGSNFDLVNLKDQNPIFVLAYDKIKIQSAWEYLKAKTLLFSDVIIGVVDTDMDIYHLEFEGINLGQTLKRIISPGVHGTAVMGIIGANNLSAVSGANYTYPQMNGILSGVLTPSQYAMGLRDINEGRPVDFEGALNSLIAGQAQIINLSLGAAREDALSEELKNDPCTNKLDDKYFIKYSKFFGAYFTKHPNILFSVAAGNENVNITDSAFVTQSISKDNVLIVGGANLVDGRQQLGNYGSDYGLGVTISAPAEGVYTPAKFTSPLDLNDYWNPESTTPPTDGECPTDTRRFFGGTSASAPMVTGVAAILKSLEPGYQKYQPAGFKMDPVKIKEVLIKSADAIFMDNPDEKTKLLGQDCSIRGEIPPNSYFRGCRLNAYRAVAWYFPPVPSTLSYSDLTSNSVKLNWSKNEDPDFQEYHLYRADHSNVSESDVLVTSITEQSQTSYTNTNLQPNTTYYYKLFTFDQANLFSSSNEISFTTLPVIPPFLGWKASLPISDCQGPIDSQGNLWFESNFNDTGWQEITIPDFNTWGCDSCDRYYRRYLNLPPDFSNIIVSFASDDGLWLYINGNFINHWGGDCHQYGCVNNPYRCFYSTWVDPLNITSFLRPGLNLIAVHVSDGGGDEIFNLQLSDSSFMSSATPNYQLAPSPTPLP